MGDVGGAPDRSHSIWSEIMVLKDHTVQSAQVMLLPSTRTHKTFQHVVSVFCLYAADFATFEYHRLISLMDGPLWC